MNPTSETHHKTQISVSEYLRLPDADRHKYSLSEDRTITLITDLNTQHLINIMRKIERDDWRRNQLPLILAELANRGFKQSNPEWFI